MTPEDRLQAAIEKLTAEREATNTVDHDWIISDNGPDGWFPALQIAVVDSAWDACIPVAQAKLVVTLHGTIDAQLSILRHAIEEYSPGDDVQGYITDDGLALADAILEVQS